MRTLQSETERIRETSRLTFRAYLIDDFKALLLIQKQLEVKLNGTADKLIKFKDQLESNKRSLSDTQKQIEELGNLR